MVNHRLLRASRPGEAGGNTLWSGDYQAGQVANIVRRYQELRSAVELVSSRHDRAGGRGSGTGKEEILCILMDVDRAIDQLTFRQRLVLKLLKQGYSCEQIGVLLGIGAVTAKFHARAGFFQLTTYLNLS